METSINKYHIITALLFLGLTLGLGIGTGYNEGLKQGEKHGMKKLILSTVSGIDRTDKKVTLSFECSDTTNVTVQGLD